MKHILFPVDFSSRSEAARPLVQAWAQRYNAKITLLHTIQIPITAYGGPDGYPIIIDIPSIKSAAADKLAKFDMPGAERIVTMGDPAYEIVEYAGVDLIMMATHGYGKFRSFLLGSVTSKVLHDAHCPVWTSAHTEDLERQGRTDIRTILSTLEVETEATKLAADFGATLQLVAADDAQAVRDAAIEHSADLIVTGRNKVSIIHQSPCPVLSL
jgi:nucleotide-binding universal stress UspA family protein